MVNKKVDLMAKEDKGLMDKHVHVPVGGIVKVLLILVVLAGVFYAGGLFYPKLTGAAVTEVVQEAPVEIVEAAPVEEAISESVPAVGETVVVEEETKVETLTVVEKKEECDLSTKLNYDASLSIDEIKKTEGDNDKTTIDYIYVTLENKGAKAFEPVYFVQYKAPGDTLSPRMDIDGSPRSYLTIDGETIKPCRRQSEKIEVSKSFWGKDEVDIYVHYYYEGPNGLEKIDFVKSTQSLI